mgnify:CR=1 FL=1
MHKTYIASFQSTLPARGATITLPENNVLTYISIHTPREGSDYTSKASCKFTNQFQSTLPARGATNQGLRANSMIQISIHTPREGSDVILITMFML